MLLPMLTFDWQVLRAVLRAAAPPTGRQLRLTPSRRTKDGTFLGEYVRAGLLRVVRANPDPFKATYAMTDRGRQAAEYGEFECDLETWKRWKTPATAG
jgi:hypothetical protein